MSLNSKKCWLKRRYDFSENVHSHQFVLNSFIPNFRYLLSRLGRKNSTKLSLILVIYCSPQKRVWNIFSTFTMDSSNSNNYILGKDVYEDFVRERVEEERREKRNRMKEKKDDFRRLMEDARLNGK